MALNISKGNMYDFITHTWNTVKGTCTHDCSYCYVKRWGSLNPVRLDEKEFRTKLGDGNFIFVGSSNDMFAAAVPTEWIQRTLDHCKKFDNRYLFQTKNPVRLMDFELPPNSVVCTTIETNRFYPEIMNNSPKPIIRAEAMSGIKHPKYVTIEPILDFDLNELIDLIRRCNPVQVNIGADSGNHGLPEPSAEKVLQLIIGLEKFTKVKRKKNLIRIIGKELFGDTELQKPVEEITTQIVNPITGRIMELTKDQILIGTVRTGIIKNITLRHYFPERKERKKYYGCKFTYECEGENLIPIILHIWLGKNHKDIEKYHKVFVIPEEWRLPLIAT